MSTILQKERARYAALAAEQKRQPTVVYTEYTSLPVPVPANFLAPLSDTSQITVKKIDFAKSAIPAYKNNYAVVLDGVLSQEECDELIRMVEMSAGAHGHGNGQDENARGGEEVKNNGWKTAMVNAGRNHEVLAIDYRNSDRIIWDEATIVSRLWARVLQGAGMREYFSVLDGKEYLPVIGPSATREGERWVCTEQGLNERMRFLKYGPAQYFKEHCDGTYETPDGKQRSFYTYHLYLNDSAQALGIKEGSEWDDGEMLRGGATTFWSNPGYGKKESPKRVDVDPKAGRVLIFQHRGLLHSGDEVTQGVKYTMRSDVMFEWEIVEGEDDGEVVFASG